MRGFQGLAAGLGDPGIYLGWDGFQIQLGNLIVIIIMVVLFLLALVVPFPRGMRRK